MSMGISRRRFLKSSTAGLSALALPRTALAQNAAGPAKQIKPEALSSIDAVAIEVRARPLVSFDPRDRSHVRFGSLQYRSGLILTSPYRGFGGLSGLRLDAKGERFIAISDKARWFTGRIVYRGREMVGLEDVEASPLLGPEGRPITERGWYDSESIALDGSSVYVAFERVHQLLKYDFARDFVRAPGVVVPLPPAVQKLSRNKGLEALVMVPKGLPLAGTLIAISERGLDKEGNITGFLIAGKTPGGFSVRRSDNFDVSDAAFLPPGDILILERKFSWLGDFGVRIRRIALASIAPGAVVDGPSIFHVDLGSEIDNMEALDVHVTEEGETVLTMLSDDNFSLIQRNLLLQFTLVE